MATSIVLPERFPLTPGCRPPPGPLRGLLCREAVLMATRPLRLAETRLEKLKSQTAMGKLSVSRQSLPGARSRHSTVGANANMRPLSAKRIKGNTSTGL